MHRILIIDVGSIVLVVITLIIWVAILIEKFIHPRYKNIFRGTIFWPIDEDERKRLKKCIQGIGLYYFSAVILLLFSTALGLLMGFGGIFYAFFIYFWLVVAKRKKHNN